MVPAGPRTGPGRSAPGRGRAAPHPFAGGTRARTHSLDDPPGMSASAVTLHHLASEVGAGDIVDQIWFDLPDDVTATGLYERISHLQSELLVRHIDDLLAGTAPRSPQSGHVSVWPPRRPSDGCLDLTASGTDVDRMVRALADPY